MTDEKKPPQGVGCAGAASSGGQLKPACMCAVCAGKPGLLDADCTKSRVRPVTRATQGGAATGVAPVGGMLTAGGLRHAAARLKCHLYLAYFRLRRVELGFYIVVRSLQCRLLGLEEPKVLAKNRRTAVLVDQFFKRVK